MILGIHVHPQHQTLHGQEGLSAVGLRLDQSQHTQLLFQSCAAIRLQINLNIRSETIELKRNLSHHVVPPLPKGWLQISLICVPREVCRTCL